MKLLEYSNFLIALATSLLLVPTKADESKSIRFSDGTKAGTMKISLGRGTLSIQGTDMHEVSVKTQAGAISSQVRADNLRVVSTATDFRLSEKDNVITLETSAYDSGQGSGDFEVTVPRNTNLIVQNTWGGQISCAGVSGDIDINCMDGEIRLDEISGGVVISTMSGRIRAGIREIHEDRPLSFTALNGPVELRLPDNAKASFRLRTHNGSVLTDFPPNVFVTKSEVSGPASAKGTYEFKGPSGKRISASSSSSAQSSSQSSSEATAENDGIDRIKPGSSRARRTSDPVAQSRTKRDESENKQSSELTVRMGAAIEITGGKLVTTELNGGGPVISVSTMKGDIIVRKLETTR